MPYLLQSYIQSSQSQKHIPLSRLSSENSSLCGVVAQTYLQNTGKGRGGSDCLGPAPGPTNSHGLSVTSTNILFPNLGEKSEDSFSQAVPFFHLQRTKQITHFLSLRWESLST